MTYSDIFKNLLREMLSIERDSRPDFIQLLCKMKAMNIDLVCLNEDWPDITAPSPIKKSKTWPVAVPEDVTEVVSTPRESQPILFYAKGQILYSYNCERKIELTYNI